MYSNWLFQENPKYNINRFVLQGSGKIVEGSDFLEWWD